MFAAHLSGKLNVTIFNALQKWEVLGCQCYQDWRSQIDLKNKNKERVRGDSASIKYGLCLRVVKWNSALSNKNMEEGQMFQNIIWNSKEIWGLFCTYKTWAPVIKVTLKVTQQDNDPKRTSRSTQELLLRREKFIQKSLFLHRSNTGSLKLINS